MGLDSLGRKRTPGGEEITGWVGNIPSRVWLDTMNQEAL